MTSVLRLAVLGIGQMGLPMAGRLCEAGYEVHVWNRSREKAERLRPLGAIVHETATQAVAQAPIVISLLEHGEAVADVLFEQGAAAAMRAGSLFIDMASIRPQQARDHAERLSALGLAHLDAPVSGGTWGAKAGTLAIMVGGDEADVTRAAPVFSVLGRATHVGPHGAGQLSKLANQMIVGTTIAVVAEALLLCERGGADPAKVKQAITGGAADSRILQVHGQRMIDRQFEASARMSIQRKDLRNVLSTADLLSFEAPVTRLIEQLFDEGIGLGLADADHSAVYLALARRNGMG